MSQQNKKLPQKKPPQPNKSNSSQTTPLFSSKICPHQQPQTSSNDSNNPKNINDVQLYSYQHQNDIIIIFTLMNEIQQAREGLLVYLEANRQYIDEKVYNEFNVQCIELQTINKLEIEKVDRVIKEIFDFGDNKVYHYFFSHIKSNTKNYIKEQYAAKAIASFYVVDIEKLTDIVKYCINNGFNQQEIEKENKRLKEAEERKNRVYIIQQPQVKPPPKDQFAYVKPRISSFLDKDKILPKKEFVIEKYTMPETNVLPRISTFLDKDKIPVKKQFVIQKFAMPEMNVLPRYLSTIPKQSPPKPEQQPPAPVAPLEDAYLLAHKKVLRERLEKIFNFYCYEQQNFGQGSTFDRIKSNGQKMSLGKFMQFCQYTRLFFSKEITKDTLMLQFKKNCEGKTQIQFQLFQKLLMKFDEKYLKIMGHDPVNNPIATFQARLLLNQPDRIRQLKKHRHLVFGTKIKQGREIKDKPLSDRYNKKELTGHSGKFSSDLEQIIKERHEQPVFSQRISPTKVSSDSYIQLNQLKKLKLPKLNWILEQEEQDRLDKLLPKR